MSSRRFRDPSAWFAALILPAVLLGCDSQSGLTEEADPPSVPVLASPADGADDVADDLALEWSPADDGTVFHVIVATDRDLTEVRAEVPNHPSPLFVLTNLQIGKTYYWRVRAVNPAGESDWSPVRSFTPAVVGVPPPSPDLVAPVPDAITPLETVLYWNAAPGAVSYDVQVAQEDVFVRMDVDREGILTTYRNIGNLITGYEYFWRVRARNYSGVSAWSPSRRFHTSFQTPGS